MADANLKARPPRTKRTGHIMATLRDTPDAPSTAQLMQPQQPFMPWGHIDLWLATAGFFKAGQRVNVSIDYIRQSLTVTPEYDDAAKARERAERTIELKAQSDQLGSAWRAQEAKRPQRRNRSASHHSNC
ncbi:hypothetical protein [Paraburkholderia sp. RL17-337-BIB-A]|uniref:hypothetical protein n=1 Tax=Paraburkholderia sp. RL17-337-BIB-A TaxID=3031636 RepID=UPI0038B9B7BC